MWVALLDGQREKLTGVGVEPLPAPPPAPALKKAAKARTGGPGAFGRGVAALRQYKTRTGSVTVPRGHVEALEDGAARAGEGGDAAESAPVRLGVWISNTKSRRAKLTPGQLAQLAELGLDWA